MWVTVGLFFELQLRYTGLKSDWSSEKREANGGLFSQPTRQACKHV